MSSFGAKRKARVIRISDDDAAEAAPSLRAEETAASEGKTTQSCFIALYATFADEVQD
jgi:hypothetical protein